MIGTTAAVASLGAAFLARAHSHNAIVKQSPELEGKKHLLQRILARNIETGESFALTSTPPKPALHKLEQAFIQFDSLAEAREQAKLSPIQAEFRASFSGSILVIIKKMRKALDPTSTIDEGEVNQIVKLHSVLAEIVKRNGLLVSASIGSLVSALRKANLVSQGRMDKDYLELICPAIEYSLMEAMKALLRGSEKPDVDELIKIQKQLSSYVTTINKWAEKQISL